MIKIDADTNVVIDNPYGESDLGRFMAAAATSDGGYVLIGEKIEKEGDEPQIGRLVVTKFDQAGNLIWEHLGSDFSGGVDVALHDEDIYITGNVNGIENTLDYYVAKLNSQGILKWDTTFGGSDYDYPSELILDKTGNIFIIGQTASKGAGRYDLNFIKIDAPADPTSVENNKIESTEVYNYPNPFSSSTTVTVYCEDVNPETIKMYLYTSSGRLTCTYTGFSGTGGAYSRTINANELAPGVYYYKVLTGNSEFRGRMIHQR